MFVLFRLCIIDKERWMPASFGVETHMPSVSEVQLKTNVAFLWLGEALRCKLVSKGD